jgi:hypothetical protein
MSSLSTGYKQSTKYKQQQKEQQQRLRDKRRAAGLCLRCGVNPPAPPNKSSPIVTSCVDCSRIVRERRRQNIERVLLRQRERRKRNHQHDVNPSTWLTTLLNRARRVNRHSKFRRHIACDLTHGQLCELLEKQQGRCAVTGMIMTYRLGHLLSCSIDRVDSAGIYTISNVVFTCRWVNIGRGSHNIETFKELVLQPLLNSGQP